MSITTPTQPKNGTTSTPSGERRGRTWWHVANSAIAASAVVLAVVALTDGTQRGESPAPAAPPAASAATHEADRIPLYRYDIHERGRLEREAQELCGTRALTPPQQC